MMEYKNFFMVHPYNTRFASRTCSPAAIDSALKAIYKENEAQAKINIYVQQPSHTPLLQVVDYILWTIFRFYEKGETRYMDFMKDKIKIINDIFAKDLEDKKNETCGG